ncbi:MAG: class I SAM-dependent methyltransferase [Cryomorphaceae bacterium]
MPNENDYLDYNRALWNAWTQGHISSDFYDVPSFLEGRNSLTDIELEQLGDVKGKSILHLQCHFGQDTISLNRLGAKATGIDLSNEAITAARDLATKAGSNTRFIECDVYSLPDHLDETFDIVYASFGTIGWLPDIHKWAAVVKHFTKPGGYFAFAEFHPVVWMFDPEMKEIVYRYFKSDVIVEDESDSYADGSGQKLQSVTWNHGLSEVISALLSEGFQLDSLKEFDYSPHNCFKHTEEFQPGKFRIKHLKNRIPMVYALRATRK